MKEIRGGGGGACDYETLRPVENTEHNQMDVSKYGFESTVTGLRIQVSWQSVCLVHSMSWV